ncbi:MAG TPA: asparagine synthetase B family protein [Blastocatellia bacterium]|nr:asparagine synthetase B family protein [Blastocatellia bacterium]
MSAIIGYWGAGVREELDALLAVSISATPHTFQRLSLPANRHNGRSPAAIACFGRHVQTNGTDGMLTASLSASGLSDGGGALVEAQAHCLRLRRDAFGRVPLYWLQSDGAVWFATRLQLLLPILKAKVSPAGLYGYTCFSWIPSPLTPVENIFAVPAGCEVVWKHDSAFGVPASAGFCFGVTENPAEAGTPNIVRRWHEWQAVDDEINDEAEAVTQLRTLLDQAVEEQTGDISSDETVGVFLSGGLDSAVTAALLVRAGMKVRAYTLDFGEYGLPEVSFAEGVARHLKIPLIRVDASPRRIREALPATARALDLPFGDGVTAPLLLLSEAAACEVGVGFNGEGGDQLFGGWANKPLIAAGIYQQSHPAGDDFERAYLRTFHRLHGSEAAVYSEAVRAEVAKLNPLEWLREALDNSVGHALLHRLRRANLMLKGAQNIQPRATNLALAHGLMVRTPFCSLPLAQLTFRLTGELCLRGPCEKYLLKRAVEDWLPAEVVWREKRGMGVPLTQWCLGPLWRELGRWLGPDALRAEGHFQPDIALRVATGQLSGQIQGRRIGEILWLLMMWQVWQRTVLRQDRLKAPDFKQSLHNPFWLPQRWWQWRYRAMT